MLRRPRFETWRVLALCNQTVAIASLNDEPSLLEKRERLHVRTERITKERIVVACREFILIDSAPGTRGNPAKEPSKNRSEAYLSLFLLAVLSFLRCIYSLRLTVPACSLRACVMPRAGPVNQV